MENRQEIFKHLLLQENKKHNLVSRKTVEADIEQHIDDSRKIMEYHDLNDKTIVDIGSGAGFPGLVLALFCPQMEIVLAEADVKKSQFLNYIKKELDLPHVSVVNERIEMMGQSQLYRGQFDYCTVRAVAALNVLVEYGLPLLKIKGKMIAWKGPSWQEELQQAQTAIACLGGGYVKTHVYSLENSHSRSLIEIEKRKTTDEKYPRRIGIPAKRPINNETNRTLPQI
jgi:16S rRNA (guanine527-N7)-methyltransferase